MIDDILQLIPPRLTTYNPSSEDAVNALLDRKNCILQTKLDVITWEIRSRLQIRHDNLERLYRSREEVEERLRQLSVDIRYRARDHGDKRVFYEALIKLDAERRSSEVECWRDLVDVLRDFLTVWEAHQQAQARALFLGDA